MCTQMNEIGQKLRDKRKIETEDEGKKREIVSSKLSKIILSIIKNR